MSWSEFQKVLPQTAARRRRPARSRSAAATRSSSRTSSARRSTSWTSPTSATGSAATATRSAAQRLLRVEGVPHEGLREDRRRGGRRHGRASPAASSTSRCQGGFPAERIALHGNNKSRGRAASRRSKPASDGSSSTRFDELELLRELTTEMDVVARVLLRVTPGVEAHTHDYLDDRRRGHEVRLHDRRGRDAGDRDGRAQRAASSSSDCTRTSAPRSSTSSRSTRPRGRWSGSWPRRVARRTLELPELDLGGGLGIAVPAGGRGRLDRGPREDRPRGRGVGGRGRRTPTCRRSRSSPDGRSSDRRCSRSTRPAS